MKCLVVFDFDHTLLDDNSDTAVIALAGRDEIPREIKNIEFTDGWTAFMQAIFTYLHEKGVKNEEILELVQNLPPVSGMIELIKILSKHREIYDMIIISDSNSQFIHVWLEKHGIDECFTKVFTNPAEVVDGMLKITPYHDQDNCKLSTRNLCKGQVLEEFLSEQHKKDVTYDQVIYTGDGVNDFCPTLRLSDGDLVCPRNGYKLSELVNKVKKGTSLDNSGKPHVIRARIFCWDTGNDISKHLNVE